MKLRRRKYDTPPPFLGTMMAMILMTGAGLANAGATNDRTQYGQVDNDSYSSSSSDEKVDRISLDFLDALAKTQRELKQVNNRQSSFTVIPQQKEQPEGGVAGAEEEEQAKGVVLQILPKNTTSSVPSLTPSTESPSTESPSSVSLETLEAEILAETIQIEDDITQTDGAEEEERSPSSEEADESTTGPTMITTSAPTPVPYEDWWDSGVRTNFDYKVPFNFTYIFFIGGVCNGKTPDNWYSQFVEAGAATFDVTETICYQYNPDDPDDNPDNVYSRDYHLDALAEVEERVGDKLNETLVITVAVGLESDWTPVADLLRKGMAFWHAKEDPNNFFLEDYGLVPEEVLYFYFRWDEETVATIAGQELCRLRQGSPSLNYAQLWTHGRNGSLNYRTEMAIESFKQHCPETKLENVWNLYSDQTAAYRTTLLFNPYPDIILATQDNLAADILKVAEDNLPANAYNRIAATGWNNNKDYIYLLENRKILTTVNQVVHFPNQGLWNIIGTVLDVVQDLGLNSTAAIQSELNLESTTILADTLLKSSDNVGYLISSLLEGYDPDSPASKEVKVSSGLFDTTITEMIPFEGKFNVVIWLKTSWNDPRLAWNPFVYEGKVTVDAERIWTPALYLKNQMLRKDLYTSQASIVFDGTVTLEENIYAELLCETDEDLRSFPFDSYVCTIDLAAPAGISLDQEYGFEIIGEDAHFWTQTDYYMANTSSYGEAGESPDRGNLAIYELSFQRKHFTAWVRLIVPAVLINWIGFIAFWIPQVEESVALGVTSFLCALAFRETVDMPDTADVTWSEVFIMVNVSYQASVLLIIWISYSKGGRFARKIQNKIQDYNPKRVYKKTKKKVVESEQAQRIKDRLMVSMAGNTGIKYTDDGIPEDDLVVPFDPYDETVRSAQREDSGLGGIVYQQYIPDSATVLADSTPTPTTTHNEERVFDAGSLHNPQGSDKSGDLVADTGTIIDVDEYEDTSARMSDRDTISKENGPLEEDSEIAEGDSENPAEESRLSSPLVEEKPVEQMPADRVFQSMPNLPPPVRHRLSYESVGLPSASTLPNYYSTSFRTPQGRSSIGTVSSIFRPPDLATSASFRSPRDGLDKGLPSSFRLPEDEEIDAKLDEEQGQYEDISMELESIGEKSKEEGRDSEGGLSRSWGILNTGVQSFHHGLHALGLGSSHHRRESFRSNDTWKEENVDWIGRWFIVPSYFIIVISMIVGGWGFYD